MSACTHFEHLRYEKELECVSVNAHERDTL